MSATPAPNPESIVTPSYVAAALVSFCAYAYPNAGVPAAPESGTRA